MSRLHLPLLENGVSFAEDALANAIVAETEPLRWKFAILSLVQAIELSLKELLRRQHPFLVYKDVDRPKHTVSIEQATSRLASIANLKLSTDESSALKTAVDVRNQIVHHQVDAEHSELKLVFARLLGFLNDFHRVHLDEPLQDQVEDRLWQSGVKIQAYGEELYRRAQERMATDEIADECLVTCPSCGWKALCAFEPNQDTCYVCGHMESLTVCDRCQDIMFCGEEHEHNNKTYCYDCLCYITDDYWYEQAVGK
jgi:hypothetical protein